MQVSSVFKSSAVSLTPLSTWPSTAKKFIFGVATLICLGIYILLGLGVISLLVLFLSLL